MYVGQSEVQHLVPYIEKNIFSNPKEGAEVYQAPNREHQMAKNESTKFQNILLLILILINKNKVRLGKGIPKMNS